MNSRYLMIASSIVTGVLGLAASFFPKEILNSVGSTPAAATNLVVQIAGALYIGFALMNWMAKGVLIGGIYARPLARGNFAHFMIAALAITKVAMHNSVSFYIWIMAAVYGIFAVLFGIVFFTNPSKK
jgi:hypothetical protein